MLLNSAGECLPIPSIPTFPFIVFDRYLKGSSRSSLQATSAPLGLSLWAKFSFKRFRRERRKHENSETKLSAHCLHSKIIRKFEHPNPKSDSTRLRWLESLDSLVNSNTALKASDLDSRFCFTYRSRYLQMQSDGLSRAKWRDQCDISDLTLACNATWHRWLDHVKKSL